MMADVKFVPKGGTLAMWLLLNALQLLSAATPTGRVTTVPSQRGWMVDAARSARCRTAGRMMADGELERQRASLDALFRAAPTGDAQANDIRSGLNGQDVQGARCAHEFPALALWRVQWVSLPGHNEMLNCHVPHYVHMFAELMLTEKPWLFGSFYLEGGSRNFDSEEYALQPGEVGTLSEVVSCLKGDDGRLLLATRNIGRVQVNSVIGNSPYTTAECEYYADDEELELFDDIATEAATVLISQNSSEEQVNTAVRKAALAAAAAATSAWASLEKPLWPVAGGTSPFSQLALGNTEEVEHAISWVADVATSAANRAARRSLGLSDDALAEDADELGALALELDEFDAEADEPWREWGANELGISLSGLELCVWNELVATWALAGKLQSIDLLQLPREILALIPPAPAGGWDQCPVGADGVPISAACTLPGPVRRARASYLLTALLPELVESAEQRLELLHTHCCRARLLLIVHELERQRKLLTAVLALRDAMEPGDSSADGDADPDAGPGAEPGAGG
ncbi:hypothetical protein T492DRAFT_1055661 [Pavlovales sp. CCMP2436]|nr:hypothetical protein T492DRAFT_1055661 [Pavlovales sp. CCMP2436]